jgi:pimeloyl-ACP methyl ester carboxylesterase
LATEAGHQVAVPDLTAVAESKPPHWEILVDLAVEAGSSLGSTIAVIGHSGAGAFLPAMAGRLRETVELLIFIDAVVPPRSGANRTPLEVARLLDEQTIDGRLRPWLEWWPVETVAELLPDPGDRSIVASDMPVLPRAFYDEEVPVPDGWSEGPCGYLQLSHAYDAEFEEAGKRGWERRSIEADHLSIYTEPSRIWAEIQGILA